MEMLLTIPRGTSSVGLVEYHGRVSNLTNGRVYLELEPISGSTSVRGGAVRGELPRRQGRPPVYPQGFCLRLRGSHAALLGALPAYEQASDEYYGSLWEQQWPSVN